VFPDRVAGTSRDETTRWLLQTGAPERLVLCRAAHRRTSLLVALHRAQFARADAQAGWAWARSTLPGDLREAPMGVDPGLFGRCSPEVVQTSRGPEDDETGTSRQVETNRLLTLAWNASPAERRRLVDEVIVRNVPVARAVASRYSGRGVAIDDLVQVACTALVRAANKFDPAKADDFLTYAVPSIRGEVKRYFRDHSWSVRPPRRVQEVQGLIQRSGETLGREGNRQELATRLNLDESEVDAALQAQGCFSPTSLDAALRPDGDSLGDMLVADYSDYEAAEARVMVRTLVRELGPRDRLILYLRFFEGRSQREIGDEIGVTQMQVSRLISRILSQMRTQLDDDQAAAGAGA
jgi:RNA polymerase sigma-B factor